MIKNYFKIAWRIITRYKMTTTINVAGLSLGICACFVIYQICSYELSFDNFHPGKERIYRMMADVTENTGVKYRFGRVPFAVSKNGSAELTGIDHIAGVIPYNAGIDIAIVNKPSKHFDSRIAETHYVTTAIAQPEYFDIFKYKWLQGNATTALIAPMSVVITKSKALQYFGSMPTEKVIGKQIIYDDSINATVTGVIKDWEGNTDLGFTDFISAASLESNYLKTRVSTEGWGQRKMNSWVFVKLSKGTPPSKLNAQLQALVKRHADTGIRLSVWSEALSDMHFDEDVIENSFRTANRETLYGLVAIALFILTLAIINFINLSTAQSVQRAKEVGVRKVLGSRRSGLVFQLLSETFLITLFAVAIAVLLIKPILGAFQSFIPKGVKFVFLTPSTFLFLVAVTIVTSLLAGLYPAKVISSHLPVISLKGSGAQGKNEKWFLRKGLIVFQFTVSLVFIIGSLVIKDQLNYTREKDPGFNANAIIMVATPWNDSLSKVSVLAERIKKMSTVQNVALQWLPPMTENAREMQLKYDDSDQKEIQVGQVAGDENFIPLYQIKLLAGRNLAHADSVSEYIINETFLKFMGYKDPQDAIGKTLYWNHEPHPVVGVVADFHIASFHDPITPLCIINRPDRERNLAIKLATKGKHANAMKPILAQLEKEWKQVYPGEAFKYDFFDESLALLYKKDRQAGILMNTATAITIFISCIGLFGLILFASEKRAKEISIRKILGAGIGDIVVMLSKGYLLLVFISLLIASPLAWYFMNQWLDGFAYRVTISGRIFFLAGISAIMIALVTVIYQTIKAAIANPIKSLRTE